MAGSLPVALSQQMDRNGTPLAGALLYIFAGGTVSTPQNAYQDAGLTILHPWPVPADNNGRLPMFYLADGTVAVRLTDASGVVQFDYPEMLVIGPSGGSTPGPGVDPTTVFQTGDFKWRPTSESLSGFVRSNSLTIGSATSGATERANADTSALFVYLWSTFSDAICPVSGGRGASAAADFSANKTVGTPDMRSRGPFGLDTMGATAASRLTGATFASGDAITAASAGGESAHALTSGENGPHDHGGATGNPTTHPIITTNLLGTGNKPLSSNLNNVNLTGASGNFAGSVALDLLTQDHLHTIASSGSGTAHNNMPPFLLGTFYIRL